MSGRPWPSWLKVSQETWSVWQREGAGRSGRPACARGVSPAGSWAPGAGLPPGSAHGQCALQGDRAQRSRHTFFSCSEKEIATCHPQGEKAATLKSPSFQQDRFPSVLVTFRPNELP